MQTLCPDCAAGPQGHYGHAGLDIVAKTVTDVLTPPTEKVRRSAPGTKELTATHAAPAGMVPVPSPVGTTVEVPTRTYPPG